VTQCREPPRNGQASPERLTSREAATRSSPGGLTGSGDLSDLIDIVKGLSARGVDFQSLQEHLDTSSSGGKLIFHLMAALAEFERDLIRERTQAGLAAARARGRHGGRPNALTPKQVAQLRALAADKRNSVRDICATLGVSRATYYRALNGMEEPAA
jgi:DNA invertase Pin-like site-specific DNA recombinase